jgi:hypothetical protein
MAKLSSASIRLVQKMNRKNKNGEYPIYIVVCFKDVDIAREVENMVI